MVPAGVAFGLTAAIAVLIQVLERLVPMVLVAVVVLILVKLARHRLGHRAITADRASVVDFAPITAPIAAPAAPPARATSQADILHWGPPVYEDLDVPVPEMASGSRVRGARAGADPRRRRP